MDSPPLMPLHLGEYFSLKKKREELLLRNCTTHPEEKDALARYAGETEKRLLEMECEFRKQGLQMVFPHEQELEETESRLAHATPEEIGNALEQKNGEVYDLIKAKIRILRRRAEQHDSIGKLNLLLRRLEYSNCIPLIGMVRMGKVAASIPLSAFSPADREWLLRLLLRLGFAVSLDGEQLVANGSSGSEAVVVHENRRIWLSPDRAGQFSRNGQELKQISQRVQLCNAERQVKTYNEEEEKAFEELQGRYLALLKERDGILQEFYNEEKLFV